MITNKPAQEARIFDLYCRWISQGSYGRGHRLVQATGPELREGESLKTIELTPSVKKAVNNHALLKESLRSAAEWIELKMQQENKVTPNGGGWNKNDKLDDNGGFNLLMDISGLLKNCEAE